MKRQPECRSVVYRPHQRLRSTFTSRRSRPGASPAWRVARWVGVVLALLLAPGVPVVIAQPRGKPAPADKTKDNTGGKPGKPKVFDFTGLDISGRLRTPQLLYFLERANEELEKASLERRSFIPELVRSVNEEAL